MDKEKDSPSLPEDVKPPRKASVSTPQRAALKERAWADRTDEPDLEPCEETYRDGSMKNECW